jgi:hypothetical protein
MRVLCQIRGEKIHQIKDLQQLIGRHYRSGGPQTLQKCRVWGFPGRDFACEIGGKTVKNQGVNSRSAEVV